MSMVRDDVERGVRVRVMWWCVGWMVVGVMWVWRLVL